jgi:pimeloyl-ACP methyl ester carboxylesterase
VLTGAEDLLTPPTQGRDLAAGLAKGRFIEMPDLAHACMGEGASLFNRLVGDFVREVQLPD